MSISYEILEGDYLNMCNHTISSHCLFTVTWSRGKFMKSSLKVCVSYEET